MEQKKTYSQEVLTQDEYLVPSRSEYIRIARESCTRNLWPNHGGKNHFAKEKDKYPYKLVTEQNMANSRMDNGNAPLIHIKVLLIRVICAAFLFLTVFLIDTFEVQYKSFNSKLIKELVTTSQGIDKAQDYIVALFENLTSGEKGSE